MLAKDLSKEELEAQARGNEKFVAYLADQEVVKVIAVPGKLVNFVLKPKVG